MFQTVRPLLLVKLRQISDFDCVLHALVVNCEINNSLTTLPQDFIGAFNCLRTSVLQLERNVLRVINVFRVMFFFLKKIPFGRV